MAREKYIVKGVKGKPGLLVSDHVYKPGRIFIKEEWKWGDDAFNAALENGRCAILEEKKEIAEDEKEIDVDKIQKQLDKALKEYAELNPQSAEAEKLLKKISKLEEKLK